MKTNFVLAFVAACFAVSASRAHGALTQASLASMTASASSSITMIGPQPILNDPNAQILTLNGISVASLQLGTTTFSGNPGLPDQLPPYADEFGLSANASADGQTYVQTMFPQPTKLIFLIEKGGNDNGSAVGLDAGGNEIGGSVSFVAANFNKTLGYTVFQGQPAGGLVITSDIPVQGIRFRAPGIDPVTVASLPIPEPAAYAVALAALGVLAPMARRRSTNA